MKQTVKRILSLVLAGAMIIALAACNNTGSSSSSGTTPSTPATPSTPSASTPAEPAQPTVVRGEIDPWQELNPDGSKKKLTIGIQQNINVTDYDDNAFTKYIEERMNIDLEFVLFASDNSSMKTQFTTMVAGGEELPDVLFYFYLSKEDQALFGDDGYLVDLAPYFDNHENWDLAIEYDWATKMYDWQGHQPGNINFTLYDYRTPEGAMYSWPGLTQGATTAHQCEMFINQVWLDKLGLEMPTNLDELVEVLRAFKTQDPNGNGKSDEIPMMGFANHIYGNIPQWIVNTMGEVYWNNNAWYSVTDEGEVYLPYVQEGYREALKFMKDLNDEGLLDPLTYTVTKDEIKGIITPASGEALCGVISGHYTVHTDRDSSDVFMEYEILPPFEGALIPVGSTGENRYYHITTDCEDLDLAMEFLFQWCGIEEFYHASRYGEEGVDWEYCKDYETGLQLPYVINDKAFNGQNNSTWSVSGPVYYNNQREDSRFREGNPNPPSDVYDMKAHTQKVLEDMTELYGAMAAKNNPTYNHFVPGFNAEEIEENGTSVTDLKEFVKSQRALFATGQLDPYSDADWNEYLKTCESMGLSTVVKNAQAAFDRVYGG